MSCLSASKLSIVIFAGIVSKLNAVIVSRSIRSVKRPWRYKTEFCAHSEQNADLCGGCWSKSRYSVFFTINATGLLEVYDILSGLDSPVTTYRACNERLTVIAPHRNGQLLARRQYTSAGMLRRMYH